MRWLRRIALSIGILIAVALAVAGNYYYRGFYKPIHHRPGLFTEPSSLTTATQERLRQKAVVQKSFLKRQGFNTSLCFLVDMQLPSGKNRFFVYDLNKDSILLSGLVAHGCGNNKFSLTPSFSNVNGSSCTSLGKYRIGSPYQGQFGWAYKLYGMDSTNDQAYNRDVVLHSYSQVPEGETDPLPICNSRGCAMVAPGFLKQLQPLIDKSKRPVLLWIFD
ncbi:MAG TPA: murein L,D-transpeptidase catalytic domain family protein [Puia sp.]|nr:murein L,D-transpeptidase catalytic domain family protein [Puia sp.]